MSKRKTKRRGNLTVIDGGAAAQRSAAAAAELDVERVAAILRRCVDVDQIREIRDRARAIEVYQRERKASLSAQQDAAEIALRAERRLGELCSELPKGRPKKSDRGADFSLDALGISHKQSSRWQKLAQIPEPDFTEHVAAVRKKGERLTVASTIRAVSDASDYDGDEFGTPMVYVDAAREVMGGIDLDPATNPAAQARIKARRFYTKETDGLSPRKRWGGSVWMNSPYSFPLVERFQNRLIDNVQTGRVTEAVTLVNNSTEVGWFQRLLMSMHAACFPDHRISFLDAKGNQTKGNRVGQVFFYAGDNLDGFVEVFSRFGCVVVLEAAYE